MTEKYFVVYYGMDFSYSIDEFDTYESALLFLKEDLGGYGTVIKGEIVSDGEEIREALRKKVDDHD